MPRTSLTQKLLTELETLINFHSVSQDQEAVGRLLDHAADRLAARGLTIERVVHSGVHSLYASTHGQHHATVMLQGHIDVVPGGMPFRVRGDKISGRGCYDMLFATASFLELIDSLDDPSHYSISLLLTGDEEIGGDNGVGATLSEENYTCDVCILPDAGDGFGALSIGAKGVLQATIRIDGRSHHGSRPWEGDGAAMKLVRFLEELSRGFDTSSRDNSTLTVSQLAAGSAALNQGPGEAYVGIDIRFKDMEDYHRIHALLDELLAKYEGIITHEVFGDNFTLDMDTPAAKDFLEIYHQVSGTDVTLMKAHGSSDAKFFSRRGTPVLMFRPDGGNAHGDAEWLSIASWLKFHEVLQHYTMDTARV